MGANIPKVSGGQSLESFFATTERRRPRPVDQSPVEVLQQMPGLVVLERLPVPILAVDREGTILFANGAFSDMLGHAPDELLAMKFGDVFCSLAPHHSMVTLVRAHADRLVKLAHKDGYPVWATMSKSAMRRRDDALALATFHDCTEELWRNSVDRSAPPARSGARPMGRSVLGSSAVVDLNLLHEMPSPSSDWMARQPHARGWLG